MGHSTGRVSEIRIASGNHRDFQVSCPDYSIPNAGQYLMACDLDDTQAVLGVPLYLVEKNKQGFWAAPVVPQNWQPGTNLDLVGPLGHGFDLPRSIQRLALVAAGDTIARLLPLVNHAAKSDISVTLFTDLHHHRLPSVLEVNPLYSLKTALDWPDFIALDIPLEAIDKIRAIVDLPYNSRLPCPAQALVTTIMPCAGVAQCGVCTVRARRGWKLTCLDGPVFDLDKLEW
jgi:NAD(P)H-flavin reductase